MRKILVKRATVHAAGDKFVVSAGELILGHYPEYCLACEECEAWNAKQRDKLSRSLPLMGAKGESHMWQPTQNHIKKVA